MKRYYAFDATGKKEFQVEGDRLFLLCDDGTWADMTLFTLLGTNFTNAEEALVDLYTDQGGENVWIVEVKE